MLEILILSIIQGITEFIPVSSSSHLIIIAEALDFKNQKLIIDVGLHIGSFLAVIFFFRKDIFNFLKNRDLFFKIFLGSIPVMLTGYFLVLFDLIDQLRNIKVIGWTTLIFGILLYLSDKSKNKHKIEKGLSYRIIIIIGLTQILSLIPGVSRSGITITSARFLNFKRVDAAKISFLLSIPTLAAVSIFGLNDLSQTNNINFSIHIIASIFLSFVFSLITIIYFLKFIKNFNLNIFAIYRLILGCILLIFAYS